LSVPEVKTQTHSVWTVTGYIHTKRDQAPTVCIW